MIATLAPLDTRLIAAVDRTGIYLRTAKDCRTPQQLADLFEQVEYLAQRYGRGARAMAELMADGELDAARRAELHRLIEECVGPLPIVELRGAWERVP